MSMDRRVRENREIVTELSGALIYRIWDNKSVTINGTIERGVTIDKKGIGSLVITGLVEEGVKFIVSGMGDLVFTQRPPESVVKAIEKTGMGEVIMPGGYSPALVLKAKAPQTALSLSNGFNTVNIHHSMARFGQAALVAHRPTHKLKEPIGLTPAAGQPAEVKGAAQLSLQAKSIYEANKLNSPAFLDAEAEKQVSTVKLKV